MATCKECLHIGVCPGFLPSDLDKDVWSYCREGRTDEIPDIDKRCNEFKDRSRFVEVVRCRDCAVPHNKWTGCPNLNGLIPPPEHFCARGERRNDHETER